MGIELQTPLLTIMANPGDDTPNLSTRELSRTLKYDTPTSTTTIAEGVINDTPRQPDYEAINDLIRKDLADIRKTQRREHAQMLVGLARCEELETKPESMDVPTKPI